jgi:hypothetical protein
MRIVLAPAEYLQLRDRVYVKQYGRCADCGDPVSIFSIQLHHLFGRGIGGGFRMDTENDTRGVCGKCHPAADRNRHSKFIVRSDE